jgi:hypothetical protein
MFKQLDAGGGAIDRNELAARAHGYFSGRGGTPIPHAYRLAADLVIEEWQAGGAVAQEGVPDDPVEATIGDSEGMPTTIDHVLRTHRGELTVSVRFDPIRREGHPAFTAYSAERGGRGDGHSVVEALGRLAAHLVNEAHANLGALTGEERTR